jgi:hypothetical protein
MISQVEAAPRRAVRYWFEDGLVEIGAGILFLALAGLFALEGLAPANSPGAALSALGLPLVILGGMLLVGLAVRAAKERLTYPRTGYVAYPAAGPARRILAGVIGAGVSLAIVWLLAARPSLQLALGALQGVALAIVFMALSLRTGLARLAMVGFVALGGGLVATTLALGASLGSALAFGAAGVAAVLSGALALSRYLRTTALPTEGA